MAATVAPAVRTARAPMNTEEFAAELDWLLSFGMHPLVAAQQLRTTSEAILRRLRRTGHDALADRFIELSESSRRAA